MKSLLERVLLIVNYVILTSIMIRLHKLVVDLVVLSLLLPLDLQLVHVLDQVVFSQELTHLADARLDLSSKIQMALIEELNLESKIVRDLRLKDVRIPKLLEAQVATAIKLQIVQLHVTGLLVSGPKF